MRGVERSKPPDLLLRNLTNRKTPIPMTRRDPKMATTPPADTPFFWVAGSVEASLPLGFVVVTAPTTPAGTVTPWAAVTTRTKGVVVVKVSVALVSVAVEAVTSTTAVFVVPVVLVLVSVVIVTVELELVVVVDIAVAVARLIVVAAGGSVKPSQSTNPSLQVCEPSSRNLSQTRSPAVT